MTTQATEVNAKLGKPLGISNTLFAALEIGENKIVREISEETVHKNIKKLRKAVSFWREYPDILLDQLKSPAEKFNFYFYQRIFLRIIMRHRYIYAVFPRAYSKSFLAVLCLYVRCMLFPNSKLFIVSGGKEQAAKIATEKLEDIWKFFPALRNELVEGTGLMTTKLQKDYVKLVFKNGSSLDIVAARQSARGGRRTSGLIEEVILVPPLEMNEVIIPLMNVSRRAACGAPDKDDITNKSQIYVTTAGRMGTFAYEKMLEILNWSIIRDWESMVMGGTWRIPHMEGLLDKDFAKTTQQSETYSKESFDREYESIWSGGEDGSYFNAEDFDNSRTLTASLTTTVPSKKKNKNVLLVGVYDVARYASGDKSSITLIEGVKNNNGYYTKNIRNIESLEGIHFLQQSIYVKRMIMNNSLDKFIIDANGVGAGLIDFLTVTNVDEKTGVEYPPFGIDKESDDKGNYKDFYDTRNEYSGIIYLVKANDQYNSDMYKTLRTQMATDRIAFLEKSSNARVRLERSPAFVHLTALEQEDVLKPYYMTDILRSELLNLYRKDEDSTKVSLKRLTTKTKKDKVSSLGMGIQYMAEMEKKNRRRPKGKGIISPNAIKPMGRHDYTQRGGFVRNGLQKQR